MNLPADVLARRVKELGPWGHRIDLPYGITTRNEDQNWRVETFRSVFRDFGFADLRGVSILDLACLDGLFAIEYARAGAITTGIDIRESNLDRARFAANALGLNNASFLQDDVRNLSVDEHGKFDIVLCCGIFYHLAFPDSLEFLRRMRTVTNRLCLLDTHISFEDFKLPDYQLSRLKVARHGRHEFLGRVYQEHKAGTGLRERLKAVSSSVTNDESFWFTRPSLYKALRIAGFDSIYERLPPQYSDLIKAGRPLFVLPLH